MPVVLAAVIVLAAVVFLFGSLLGTPEPDIGGDTEAVHSHLSRSATAVPTCFAKLT